jgi:DsbE subfamily thiol:disulfide oxidoreductase
MNRWVFVLPVAGFAVLAFFLFRSLWSPAPDIIPSVFLNKPAPVLGLPALDGAAGFTDADLRAGHVSVVNFFASWCAPCHQENDTLMALAQQPGIAVYGVAYKDRPADTQAFMREEGNPFAAIVTDMAGRGGIEWGVVAPPETFVIDGKGVVRFKYVGPLSEDALAREVLPAIAAAKGS